MSFQSTFSELAVNEAVKATQTPTATVRQRFRPLRFGFVVDPSRPVSIRAAIEAASVTWGGRFAPPIPRFKHAVQWDLGRKARSSEIIYGLIAAFEPDLLVFESGQPRETFGYGKSRIVEIANFFSHTLEERGGLAMHLVYSALYEREFQFERRHPRQLRVHRSEGRSLFQAACFGAIRKIEINHFRALQDLGATEEEVSAKTFVRQLRETAGPLRLTTEFLDWHSEPAAMFFLYSIQTTRLTSLTTGISGRSENV